MVVAHRPAGGKLLYVPCWIQVKSKKKQHRHHKNCKKTVIPPSKKSIQIQTNPIRSPRKLFFPRKLNMKSKKTRLHPNKAKHSRAKQTKAEERAQRLQGGRTVGWSETIGYKIDSYLFNNYPSKAKPSSIRALLDLCVFHTN